MRLYCCVVLLLGVLAGCQQQANREDRLPRVFPDAAVPDELVGTWHSSETRWTLVFASDGRVSTVHRPDGLVMDIAEGGITQGSREGGMFAQYVYGNCGWGFEPEGETLKAKVVIEDFYVYAAGAELSCSITEDFVGRLSEDGTAWRAAITTTTTWHDGRPEQVTKGRAVFRKTD